MQYQRNTAFSYTALSNIRGNFNAKYLKQLTTSTCLEISVFPLQHYSDVTFSTMVSQINSVPIVYPTVCSSPDQRKHQSSASLAFVREIHRRPGNSPVTVEFPAQRASNAENVSIWWLIMRLTSVACKESSALCHILSFVKFRLTCSIDKIRNWPKVYWYHKQKWVNVKGVYTLSFLLFLNRSITLINTPHFR